MDYLIFVVIKGVQNIYSHVNIKNLFYIYDVIFYLKIQMNLGLPVGPPSCVNIYVVYPVLK